MATSRLPLVVVLGATGAGKSKLAIEIAKIFKGEIISADSMQIYKGLDIITNKVSPEEQQECPHHLISYLEADHPHYNIVDFKEAALPIIDDLLSKRILPIVVGGTNYYIESVLWNFLIDKKHTSSANTKTDKVHTVTRPQTNNNHSRISHTRGTELSLAHSGVDTPPVECGSGRTTKESLDTQEILTIAGFLNGAGCLQLSPGLHQPSSSLQQTLLSPEQALQSCSSNSQTVCNGSSRVVLESLTSTYSVNSPVQFMPPNVGSFSNNRDPPDSSDPNNIQPVDASAAHSLHSFSASNMDTSSSQPSRGTAVEGARSRGQVHGISDASIEDPSSPRVGGPACGDPLCVEATLESIDSLMETREHVSDAFHRSSVVSHCDEFQSSNCDSCDVSSSCGLSREVSSDNPGLSRSPTLDIHELSDGTHRPSYGAHGPSGDAPGLLCDVPGLSNDARELRCDVRELTSYTSGLSCDISDSSELSQEGESHETIQNPRDFRHDSNALLRCLNRMSSGDLYSHLQSIDPHTACRMHPNNRRKIVRAIQVYYQCEQTMSSLLSEQHGGQENVKSGPLRYPKPCILWVKCQQPDLNARLDGRVDEMIARGLVAELEHFHKEAARLESLKRNSSGLDTGYTYTHGILQMIGFKEFHDYLQLSPEDRATDSGRKLLQQGVLDLKLATRRYARQQVRWITNRFCNRPGSNVPPIYAVDSTDLTQWDKTVEEAIEVVKAFIAGEVPIKEPEMVVPKVDAQLVRNVCDPCGGRIFLHLHEWTDHLKSKKHKFNVKMLTMNRQQLSQLLSAREQQLKQMADESLSTVDGGPDGSSPEDSLHSVFV